MGGLLYATAQWIGNLSSPSFRYASLGFAYSPVTYVNKAVEHNT